VSQTTKKKAGDFVIQKRGARVLPQTNTVSKKGKGESKETAEGT
jgi:hypothetical protein